MAFVLFVIFGCVAVLGGLVMVFARNPVYGAIALIVCLGAIAGEYLLLGAPLIAAFQILVYAGAIMVLYLFVIMLLNVQREEGRRWWSDWRVYAGFVVAGLTGFVVLWKAIEFPPSGRFHVYDVTGVAYTMFTDPTLLFLIEALGVLLLMSVVGAIYIGRKPSPREQELLPKPGKRFAAGRGATCNDADSEKPPR